MAWLITIGGVNRSALVRRGSISLSAALNARSTCGFTVKSPDGTFEPVVGAEVIVERDGVRLFGGYIWSSSKRIYAGLDYVEHDLTLVDYNFIAARRTMDDRSWLDQHAGAIVEEICTVGLAAEGIDQALIATGPVIAGEYKVTGDPSVLDALTAVAKQAKCYWYIDFYKHMRFFDETALGYAAPFSLTKVNATQITPVRSMEDYANKIILHVQQYLRAEETETFSASHGSYPTDGVRQVFGFPYPLASQPTVELDGVPVTNIGIYGVDTGKAWYWAQGSNYLIQDSSLDALTAAQTLKVTYVGLGELTLHRTADDQLGERAAVENSSGLHIQTFSISEQASAGRADEIADQLLATLSELPEVVTYRTSSKKEPLLDTLKPGDKQTILGIEYVVRSVKWTDDQRWKDLLWLEAECVRGPLLKDFAELLKSLAGRGSLPVAAPVSPDSGGGSEVTPPSQPTNEDWTLPAIEYGDDPNGNQFADLQVNYTGAMPANSDYLIVWMYRGAAPPADVGKWEQIFNLAQSGVNGSWRPRPADDETWCVCVTAASARYSGLPIAATPYKTIGVTGWAATAIAQPAAGDWALGPLEYSADAAGSQFVNVQGVYSSALPANSDYLVFWIYEGASRPDDPGKWVDSFHLTAPGMNGTWRPQPLTDAAWVMCVTACSWTRFVFPDASTPIKTINVAAWKAPRPLLSAAVEAQTIDYGGRTRYRLKITFTPDPADKNFFVCRGDFNWCNSSFVPLSGDDGEWKNVIGEKKGPMYIGGNEGFDAPLPTDGTQYRQLRLYPIGFDQNPNYVGAIVFNITFAPDGGFKVSALDPATLDSTLSIKTVGGVKKLAVADGGIGKTQIAAANDLVEWVSGVPATLGSHSRLIYNSADGAVYRWNPAHLQYELAMDGAQIKAQLQLNKLTSAEIAAGNEFVAQVSGVPAFKVTAWIYNLVDGKTYRWNGSAYVRDTNSTEIKEMLTVDKLVSGQLASGSVATQHLSTAEILIGAGGGKCGRLRINDAFGSMISFVGDDGAGYVGLYSSRGKFGGTFANPIIDLSTAGALINNASLSVAGPDYNIAINPTSGFRLTKGLAQLQMAGANLALNYNSSPAYTSVYDWNRIENSVYGAGKFYASWSPSAAQSLVSFGAQGPLGMYANSGNNCIASSRYGSYIDFSGGGGYINIGEYRIGNQVVIDASKNLRWPAFYSENLVLANLIATKWVPAYDSAGVYQGKVPIIP